MNDNDRERVLQDEVEIPGYESNQEQFDSGNLSKRAQVGRTLTNRKNKSKAQERELAGSYRQSGFQKAKRIAGSGSWGTVVADVDPGEWLLVEAKETRSGRITIDPEWIRKISHQAKQMARPWWALHCWVGEETGPYKKVVILDEDHFFQLLKELKHEVH